MASTISDRASALARASIFQQLSESDREQLAEIMEEVSVAAGERIIAEGVEIDTLCIVVSGGVDVSIGRSHRASLGPGDFFGEIGLIDGGAAVATVTATEDTTLLYISRDDFLTSVRSRELITLPILMEMARRVRENEAAGFKAKRP